MKYTIFLRNVNGKLRHSATMVLMGRSESKLAMASFTVKALGLLYATTIIICIMVVKILHIPHFFSLTQYFPMLKPIMIITNLGHFLGWKDQKVLCSI